MVSAIGTQLRDLMNSELFRWRLTVLYVVFIVITYTEYSSSKSKDQPNKVANSARGQLNRKNKYFPVRVRA